MSETTTETTETGTTTTTSTPQGGLGVNDLKIVVRTLQVCSERGAFKAEEMATVGGLYQRIVGFLQATGQLDPAPAPEGDQAEGDEQPAAEMMPEETENYGDGSTEEEAEDSESEE
jgi:hypothetical protein